MCIYTHIYYGGQDGPSKDVAVPRTCACIILHDKRGFADVIEVLKQGKYTVLSVWTQCNQKSPCKGKEGHERVRLEIKWKQGLGGCGQDPRSKGGL